MHTFAPSERKTDGVLKLTDTKNLQEGLKKKRERKLTKK
jgi:hypothetical protein